MINRVRPQPSDDPFKRGKTGKVGGIGDDNKRIEKSDREEEKRRKFKHHLEEKKPEANSEKTPSPYESAFYDKGPAETMPIEKKLPEHNEKEELLSNELSPEEDKNKKSVTSYNEHKADGGKKAEGLESDFDFSEKEISSNKTKEVKSNKHLDPFQESQTEKKEFNTKKPETDEATKKEEPSTIHPIPINVPPEIVQRSSEITNDLKVYLNSEINPIFEQMIGKILVMSTKEGIMQTEITLDNPNMENSVFYGSKILLEKYSTAPDSFNIRLTGNPQAVTAFSGNIDALTDAFKRGNFNFRVGRVEAAYASNRPLFRRKERPSSDEAGGGPLER